MSIAYTVGNEQSYDTALDDRATTGVPVRKTGKGDQGRDPEYPGGWCWLSEHEARAATVGTAYAVYEIDLPWPWNECTYLGADGRHHLLVDAVVSRKVQTSRPASERGNAG